MARLQAAGDGSYMVGFYVVSELPSLRTLCAQEGLNPSMLRGQVPLCGLDDKEGGEKAAQPRRSPSSPSAVTSNLGPISP
jgi:hypothetical protein